MYKLPIKKGFFIWFVCGITLVFLYLAATTDLFVKERENTVYPISFFSEILSEEYDGNLKKGLEAATEDYNVDMNLVDVSGEMSGDAIVSRIREEVDLGARAILLGSRENDEVSGKLGDLAKDIPIIVLGETEGVEHLHRIYSEAEQIGELLGEQIMKEEKEGKVFFLISENPTLEEERILQSATIKLKDAGFFCHNKKWEKEAIKIEKDGIIIALNKKVATAYIKEAEEKNREAGIFYTVGSTTYLLNKLDTGKIKGLVTRDEFALGYVAIETAVDLIKVPLGIKREKIDSFYLDKKELNSGKYMKILYQIN